MSEPARKKYAGAGRPTAEQARKRHHELLEKSLTLFLKKGFEQTTLDDIAAVMHMTKRTIYGLYDNKEQLFRAAVKLAIEDNRISEGQLSEINCSDLQLALRTIAKLRVDKSLSPQGKRLQSIINAESYRFPDLQVMIYRENTGPTIHFLVELFKQHAATGEVDIEKPEACASIFLAMAVGVPARAVITSTHPDQVMNVEEHIDYCVHLFLKGVTKR